MEHVIAARGLGKRYRRYDPDRPLTFQEAVFKRLRGHRPADFFWVLRGVDLAVSRGSTVAFIGRNGAGKSTLLRLIGGIGRPDEGSLTVTGQVRGLLDLGVGFHSDLTGRENVFLSGVVGGLTRNEVAQRFDEIVNFAELQHSIDSPLRTYSSGMHMRLAFSVTIHTDPDVLLIDEVLAVGDIAFQQKCLDRLARLKRNGCTMVLVSHEPGLVTAFCDEVFWLQEGRIREHGPPSKIVNHYQRDAETLRRRNQITTETLQRTPLTRTPSLASNGVELRLMGNRFGSLELELNDVRILDPNQHPTTTSVLDDGPLKIELGYIANEAIRCPIFEVSILHADGRVCYDTNSENALAVVPDERGRGAVEVRIDGLNLEDGQYYVDVGAYERGWSYTYDYHKKVYPLLIKRRSERPIEQPQGNFARAVWSLR